jgi:hypothetical protein
MLATLAARADSPPLRLIAVDDAALASVVLLGAGAQAPVLLVDPQDPAAAQRFITQWSGPRQCLARAATAAAVRDVLAGLAGQPCSAADDLIALARGFWPAPKAVVLAPAGDYAGLLRGAALAGAAGAALLPVDAARPPKSAALTGWSSEWLAVGGAGAGFVPPDGAALRRIDDPAQVLAESVRRLGTGVETVVVANPADRRGRFAPTSLSLFAPLVAQVHRAPLVLVSGAAAALVETEVQRAIAVNGLTPTHLYLVGDELALRSHRVPDPVFSAGGPEALGGARDVRVELFSQIQERRPQAYAVGRLVAEDATQGSALLARQLHPPARSGAPIRVLSNADQVFALGETISRTTVSDLRNAGLPVQSAFREAVTPAAIQQALGDADVLVWEGHARDLTLEEGGGIAVERTPPLVVLQGCYTLDRSDPFILIERGTQDIVATSAAIYSASGSAFARAFFDALVYDQADLGTAVRNARNYLLAVAELKQRRGHKDWTKTYRAALAFALWGDPTARPPLPTSAPKLPPASWRIGAQGLELTVPSKRLKTASVDRYTARPVPRAMLSGLILRGGDAPGREVKELFFAAVPAPTGITAACAAPGWEVLSQYAAATRMLFVLARPPGDKPGAGAAAGSFAFPLVADASACPRPAAPVASDDEADDDDGPP